MKKRKNRCFIVLLLLLCVTGLFPAAGVNRAEAAEAEMTEAAEQKESVGWHREKSGGYYYIQTDGTRAKGWLSRSGKTYFLDANGIRITGWRKIRGYYYYFSTKGIRQSKWLTIGSRRYYLDPSNQDARTTGWKKIGTKTYYFNSKGVMVTGWVKYEKRYYYLKSTGVMVTGWNTIDNKAYYFEPSTGARAKGWQTIDGYDYYFSTSGVMLKNRYTKDGFYVDAEGKKLKKCTLKEYLQIALKPVGSTLYVWGGGWNLTDDGGNIDARTIGVSKQWKKFFNAHGASYDYRTTRYQSRNGLDCSGFVGWTIYNAFNTRSGNSGYVCPAESMTRKFSSKGWGTYTAASAVRDYRAGDIMSTSAGHVYIVLGTCSDGSIVFIHSSPSGVQINGTCTRSGKENSKAVQLATKYMKKYYPAWYAKFPKCSRPISYLTQYSQMRWYLTGSCMMSDPEGYADMTASQILKDLF